MKILIYFITLFIFSTFAFACDNKNSDINFNKENNMNNDNIPNNPKYAYFSSLLWIFFKSDLHSNKRENCRE